MNYRNRVKWIRIDLQQYMVGLSERLPDDLYQKTLQVLYARKHLVHQGDISDFLKIPEVHPSFHCLRNSNRGFRCVSL